MSRISELIDGGLIQTTDRVPALRTGAVIQVQVGDIVTQDSSNVAVTGGAINGTLIGNLLAAAGTFTTLGAGASTLGATTVTTLGTTGVSNFGAHINVTGNASGAASGEGEIGANATIGLQLIGQGTSYDATLGNRGGGVALGVLPNSLDLIAKGALSVDGTLGVSGLTTLSSTVNALGSVNLLSASPTLSVGSSNLSTGNAGIEIGQGRTGDGFNFLDFVGDTTYADYGLRIERNGTANGASVLRHRGTGDFTFTAAEAANMLFQTSGTTALTINSSQGAQFSSTLGVTGATTLSNVLKFTSTIAPLSGTGNVFGTYLYSGNDGNAYLDALHTGASITGMKLRTYNGGTYNTIDFSYTGAVTLPSTLGVAGNTTLSGNLTLGTNQIIYLDDDADSLIYAISDDEVRINTGGSSRVTVNNTGTSIAGTLGVAGFLTVNDEITSIVGTNNRLYVRGALSTANGMNISSVNSVNSLFQPLEFSASSYSFSSGAAQFAGTLGVTGNTTVSEGQITVNNGDPAENVAVFTATNASYTGGVLQVISTRAASATEFDLAKFNTSAGATTNCRIRGDGDLENVNNSYTGISDVKLKQDIVEPSSQLEDVLLLAGLVKKYRLIEQVKNDPNAHTHLGFIAQEIQAISPGLIKESPDKVRTLVEELDEDGAVVMQDVSEKRTRQVTVDLPVMIPNPDYDSEVEGSQKEIQQTEIVLVDVEETTVMDGAVQRVIPAHQAEKTQGVVNTVGVVDEAGSPVLEAYDFVTGQEPVMKWVDVPNGETTLSVKYSIAHMKLFKAFGEYVEKTDARLKALEP